MLMFRFRFLFIVIVKGMDMVRTWVGVRIKIRVRVEVMVWGGLMVSDIVRYNLSQYQKLLILSCREHGRYVHVP